MSVPVLDGRPALGHLAVGVPGRHQRRQPGAVGAAVVPARLIRSAGVRCRERRAHVPQRPVPAAGADDADGAEHSNPGSAARKQRVRTAGLTRTYVGTGRCDAPSRRNVKPVSDALRPRPYAPHPLVRHGVERDGQAPPLGAETVAFDRRCGGLASGRARRRGEQRGPAEAIVRTISSGGCAPPKRDGARARWHPCSTMAKCARPLVAADPADARSTPRHRPATLTPCWRRPTAAQLIRRGRSRDGHRYPSAPPGAPPPDPARSVGPLARAPVLDLDHAVGQPPPDRRRSSARRSARRRRTSPRARPCGRRAAPAARPRELGGQPLRARPRSPSALPATTTCTSDGATSRGQTRPCSSARCSAIAATAGTRRCRRSPS